MLPTDRTIAGFKKFFELEDRSPSSSRVAPRVDPPLPDGWQIDEVDVFLGQPGSSGEVRVLQINNSRREFRVVAKGVPDDPQPYTGENTIVRDEFWLR